MPRKHSHFFTEDGLFGSRDWNGEQVDDGTYRVVDADTFVISLAGGGAGAVLSLVAALDGPRPAPAARALAALFDRRELIRRERGADPLGAREHA